ncbi:SigE family RNA polymerase sigma factor [Actinospica robiniae]|uniref:SigE family RNA polymerase sigma factor n=1 Tax=Actinospica robiniae TaxID=304901 RepID=UPI000410908E|nr:SigE family RNA polymerase sigma factor [Actinospica robiniae]
MRETDEEGFHEFVASRWPRLVRLALGLTGDLHLAEDLVQTALAKVYASWRRVRQAEDLDGYVYRVLCNANHDRFRKHRVVEDYGVLLSEPGEPDETATVEERAALWAALAELAPKQRAAVLLRYFEDLTEAQTAAVLGVSIGTVKSQTSDALRRLRTSPHLTDGGSR